MKSIILKIKNKQIFLPEEKFFFPLDFLLEKEDSGFIIFSSENGFMNKKVNLVEVKPEKISKDLKKSFFYKIEEIQ